MIGESCGSGIESFLLSAAVEEGLVSARNGGSGRRTQMVTQTYVHTINKNTYSIATFSNLF